MILAAVLCALRDASIPSRYWTCRWWNWSYFFIYLIGVFHFEQIINTSGGPLKGQWCKSITRPPWCESPCCIVSLSIFVMSLMGTFLDSTYAFYQAEYSQKIDINVLFEYPLTEPKRDWITGSPLRACFLCGQDYFYRSNPYVPKQDSPQWYEKYLFFKTRNMNTSRAIFVW